MTKPHIILIPGAWHSANCFDTLLPHLKENGYATTAVDLVSVAAEPPVQGLEADSEHIRRIIKSVLDIGQNVVLVMHSYGGAPGGDAVQGLAKAHRGEQPGVIALVYLCAFMLDKGKALREGLDYSFQVGFPFKELGDYSELMEPVRFLYHDLDPVAAERSASYLRHQSRPCFYAPVSYAAWKDVPTTYLFCKNDRTIPAEKQAQMVEYAKSQGVEIHVVELNAGHSPFLSHPEFTARVIRHTAGEEVVERK